MEALQNGQTTVEGSIEGQTAGAASHAMIEKILSEEPRWQGKGSPTSGHASSCQMSVLSLLLPIVALRIWPTTALSSHLLSSHSPVIWGHFWGVSPDIPCLFIPITPGAPRILQGTFLCTYLGIFTYTYTCVLDPPEIALFYPGSCISSRGWFLPLSWVSVLALAHEEVA